MRLVSTTSTRREKIIHNHQRKVEPMVESLTSSCDPFRSIDWRWQAAQQPLQKTQRSRPTKVETSTPSIGDEWITAARDYLGGSRTAPYSSGIKHAIALHRKTIGWSRWELEALLLTTMQFAAIAERCSIAEQTVEAFHALFFDVRDRLGESDWINSRVLGRDVDGNLRDHGDGDIWKRVAYEHGVLTLNLYMAVMRDQKLPKEFVASLGPDAKHKGVYTRLIIKFSIARDRAKTDEQRATLIPIEVELEKLHAMIYGNEGKAERAMRLVDDVFINGSKYFKAAMRNAKREEAIT